MMEIEVDIIADKQVDETIAVVIREGCAGGEARVAHSSFLGDIRERAVAVVLVQDVLTQTCHVNVRPPVIIKISHCPAHGKTGESDPRFIGDV